MSSLTGDHITIRASCVPWIGLVSSMIEDADEGGSSSTPIPTMLTTSSLTAIATLVHSMPHPERWRRPDSAWTLHDAVRHEWIEQPGASLVLAAADEDVLEWLTAASLLLCEPVQRVLAMDLARRLFERSQDTKLSADLRAMLGEPQRTVI